MPRAKDERGPRNRRGATASAPPEIAAPDAATIDALYGLEPVFEPDAPATGDGQTPWVSVECPYCWELFETQVDLTAGSTSYVEDCQVCCQPIELAIDVADDGRLDGARPSRLD